jgi:FtsH-binding integral membrane protein
MKKIITWAQGLLKDEKGTPSSKRFIGIIAGLSLCVALFINLFTEHPVDGNLINAVAALAFGALGLASVDKIWAKDKKETTETHD